MDTKTIFITSFNPFATRNILFSDVFGILSSRPDWRLVIFCPDYKKDYFEKNFILRQAQNKKNNVIIEGVKSETASRQDIIFSYLGRSLISTKTLAIHRKEILLRNKNPLTFIFSYFLNFIGWFSSIKKLVRSLDYLTISKTKFAVYFYKYKPDLIFSTDIFHVDDVHFLAEAKSRGVKTVSMIRSWDNITNKGLFRIEPDKLIVHNEVIKQEALQYESIGGDNIFVSGMPQFDLYVQRPRIPKAQFFKEVGLDPDKKTIFVAPHGNRFYQDDWFLLDFLKELPYQYIIRLPPNDTVNFSGFSPTKNFYIDDPGQQFKKDVYRDREMDLEDSTRLADELFYSDLVINYGSTITVDAVFFDKPAIIVAFDANESRPYLKNVRRFLDFSHINKMLKTQCCKIAYSKSDLVDYIKSYLENPALDKDGRTRLREAQVYRTDGKSGEAIAQFLIQHL